MVRGYSITPASIIGLILLLGVWVILATVNPTILNLDALKFSELKAGPQVQALIQILTSVYT